MGMREMKGQCEWQEARHRRLAFKYVSPWTPDGDVYRHTPFHHHVSGMDAWREGGDLTYTHHPYTIQTDQRSIGLARYAPCVFCSTFVGEYVMLC